jgi:predicted GIY-YIG superfamily endonuclease
MVSWSSLSKATGPFLEFAVAPQRERRLKRWTQAKKLALIQNQILVLSRLSQSRETRP